MGTHFLWNPINDNIVKEFDDAGNTIADYTTEPNLYGDLISQHRSGQSSFYHFDGQGSTTSLTDAAANVTDTYAYSAFGEVTANTGSTVNPFSYIGRNGYYDDEDFGDYCVRRRSYQPANARWQSPEPVGAIRSQYSYSANRPIVASDPTGLAYVFFEPSTAVGMNWYDIDFGFDDPLYSAYIEGLTSTELSLTCACQKFGRRRRRWCQLQCSISAKFTISLNKRFFDCLLGRGLGTMTDKELQWCLELRSLYWENNVVLPRIEEAYGHEQRHVTSIMAELEVLKRQLDDIESSFSRTSKCCGDCLYVAEQAASYAARYVCEMKRREGHPRNKSEQNPGTPLPQEHIEPLEGIFPEELIGKRTTSNIPKYNIVIINGRPYDCFPPRPMPPRPPTMPPAPDTPGSDM